MEDVNRIFGALVLTKVGTFRLSALSQNQDAYVGRIKNGTSDWVVTIAFAPQTQNSPSKTLVSQLAWSSLHVRSYKSEKQFLAAAGKIASFEVLAEMEVQSAQIVDWGTKEDFELHEDKRYRNSSTYAAERDIGFEVTLHSAYLDNTHGNELEDSLEFIPALLTYNFTLSR